MGDQNLTFITGKLTLEYVACVDRIAKPFYPILARASPHLGGTYFCGNLCQQDGCELLQATWCSKRRRDKLRSSTSYPQMVIQISHFSCWSWGWGWGKRGEEKPGIL